jgi:hypothetical protein
MEHIKSQHLCSWNITDFSKNYHQLYFYKKNIFGTYLHSKFMK